MNGAAVEKIGETFFISLGEKHMIYSPLQALLAIVDEKGRNRLKSILATGETEDVEVNLQPVAGRLCEAVHPPCPPGGAFSPRRVAFLMTGDCNLRCVYCAPGAGQKSGAKISRKVCQTALDVFAKIVERDGLNTFSVYLHGGEPFYHENTTRFCLETAEVLARRLNIPLNATATTNGFMEPDLARWIADHFRFVIVSLDGPPDIQNRQRPAGKHALSKDSFPRIEQCLDIFRERGLAYGIRCTVSGENVRGLPEIAEFICERFQPAAMNFEPVTLPGNCCRLPVSSPTPDEFVNGVIAADGVLKTYGVKRVSVRSDIGAIVRSNCKAADDQMVVTPDGYLSACFAADHGFSPYADPFIFGKIDTVENRLHIDEKKLSGIRKLGVESIRACKDCFCKWHCAGGCRIIHTPLDSGKPEEGACEITRKLTLYSLLEKAGVKDKENELCWNH